MRTGPLAAVGWVVAATLTLGVSWSAMQAVRTAVAPDDLASGLPAPDEDPSGTATSSPTRSAPRPGPTATTPTAATLTRAGVGGTVRVRCTDGVPELVSIIPRQGFAVDVDDSPGEVRFTSGSHRTEITVSCAGGRPEVDIDEDDRGDEDNSGPGGGNSGPGGGDDD